MLYVGSEKIPFLFNGKMGIKRVYVGGDLVYDRGGSYVYVELFERVYFTPSGSDGLITADGKRFSYEEREA